MIVRPKTTWVVLADGMRARVLKWDGSGRFAPALDKELYDAAVHGHARDLKSDRPGRAFDTGSGARHAMQPRHDPHVEEKRLFARRVAKVIDDAAEADAFDHLVLVAPPKALGALRSALGRRAGERVVAELHKDLLRTPQRRLGAQLRAVLPKPGPTLGEK